MLSVAVEVGNKWEHYHDDQGLFLRALKHIDPDDGGLLQWHDPSGDVIYNSRQAEAVAAELRELLVVCPEETHDAIRHVLRLAELAADSRHRQLKIAGD